METAGGYYDGRVSTRRPVVVSLGEGTLEVRGEGVGLSVPLSSVRVTAGVGNIRRFLRLPGGGLCDVEDVAFLDAVLAGQGKATGPSLIQRWEKGLAYVALALVATVAIVAAFVRFGVPVLAKKVAFAIPVDVESRMGKTRSPSSTGSHSPRPACRAPAWTCSGPSFATWRATPASSGVPGSNSGKGGASGPTPWPCRAESSS